MSLLAALQPLVAPTYHNNLFALTSSSVVEVADLRPALSHMISEMRSEAGLGLTVHEKSVPIWGTPLLICLVVFLMTWQETF